MRCVEGQANSYVKRERLRPCVDLMSERVWDKQTKRQPVAFVGEPCEIVVKAGVDLLIGVSEHEKKSNCVHSAYTTLLLHTQDSSIRARRVPRGTVNFNLSSMQAGRNSG